MYKSAEDYIDTLHMLWSGEYQNRVTHRLIIRKWEIETFIGSNPYWMYMNISPSRLLDQCQKTAEEQMRAKIERYNRRITAGIENGSVGGKFNRFTARQHLADVAEFIQIRVFDCGLPSDAGTIFGSIRLDRSRTFYISGDSLYFCCTFVCYFQANPDQNIDEAYGTYLDVTGRILFHSMGTKKYDLSFSGVHPHYQYPDEEKNYASQFPEVQVNQML